MLFIPMVSQLVLGIYLKLHIHERSIRPYAVVAHGVIGKIFPILGWTQMTFGFITLNRGYCRGDLLSKFHSSFLTTLIYILYQVNVLPITSWAAASLHTPRSWLSYSWLVSNGFVEVDEVPNGGIPGVTPSFSS